MGANHNGGVIQLDEATGHGLDNEVNGNKSEFVRYIWQLFSSYIEAL